MLPTILTALTVSSLLINGCSKTKNAAQTTPNAEQLDDRKQPESSNVPKKPSLGFSESLPGNDNVHIKYVLKDNCDSLRDEYLDHLDAFQDEHASYMWGLRKHLQAEEQAWKHLVRRIVMLKTEGFDVRPGSLEARARRMQQPDYKKRTRNLKKKPSRTSTSSKTKE